MIEGICSLLDGLDSHILGSRLGSGPSQACAAAPTQDGCSDSRERRYPERLEFGGFLDVAYLKIHSLQPSFRPARLRLGRLDVNWGVPTRKHVRHLTLGPGSDSLPASIPKPRFFGYGAQCRWRQWLRHLGPTNVRSVADRRGVAPRGISQLYRYDSLYTKDLCVPRPWTADFTPYLISLKPGYSLSDEGRSRRHRHGYWHRPRNDVPSVGGQ